VQSIRIYKDVSAPHSQSDHAPSVPTRFWIRTQQIQIRTRTGPDLSVLPLIFGTFCVHYRIKDQDFSYLLVFLTKKVNIKLVLIVFLHILLFKFEAKYKLGLKLNQDMGPGSDSVGCGTSQSSVLIDPGQECQFRVPFL
jgi:hypothetical protein